MNIFKLIRETNRLSKDFDKRIREVERLTIKPKYSDDLAGQMQSAFEPMRHFFKEAPLYSKVSYLESRVEELEAQNERLMDYLKIKEVATKAKESKVVLKKK